MACAYSDGLALATAATRNLTSRTALVERFDGLGRGLYRWAVLGYEHSEGESQQLLVFIHTGYLLRLGSLGSFVTPLSLAHMGNELFHFPQV